MNDNTVNQNYCGANVKAKEGKTVTLALASASKRHSWSHRNYAIWVTFCPEVSLK